MITRQQVKDPKRRILIVCVQMFIEKGFKATTMLDIIREADVSSGTFQNIFHTKDGVLQTLIEFMFSNQFGMARGVVENIPDPVTVYAAETALQLAITELNENLREIYVEAYTQPHLSEFLYRKTSAELEKTFGKYNPGWSSGDFYEAEIGSAGMMRGFMARPCDQYFTLARKTEMFLNMSLRAYRVPEEERAAAIAAVNSLDLVKTANGVMERLFSALEMTFDFKFTRK